ncbi:hypothetical protein [Pollutibacter soli]|uniref:hypothetical protein n=1 Tax=Pollutibacter soli TaxID=3034157 RepID=UPI0030137994
MNVVSMIRISLQIFVHILIIAFLTIITQIGGIIWLINLCFYNFIDKIISNPFVDKIAKLLSFLFVIFSSALLFSHPSRESLIVYHYPLHSNEICNL